MKNALLAGFLVVSLCPAVPARGQERDSARHVNIADTLKKDLLTLPDSVVVLKSKAWTLVPPAVLVTCHLRRIIILCSADSQHRSLYLL